MAKSKGKKSVRTLDTEPAESPASKREGKLPIHAWIREDIKEAFDAFIAKQRPKTTLTAHLEVALENYLQEQGAWKPAT